MLKVEQLRRVVAQARKYFINAGVKGDDVENGVAIIIARQLQPHLPVSVDQDVVYHAYADMNIRPLVRSTLAQLNEECLIKVDTAVSLTMSLHAVRTRVALGQIQPDVFKVMMQTGDIPQYLAQTCLDEKIDKLISMDDLSMHHAVSSAK